MPYRRHSNRQGSGVASEYSKAGIDTFWKIPFKNNYISLLCIWDAKQHTAHKCMNRGFSSLIFAIHNIQAGRKCNCF